jgi:hypothetical protein
VKEPPLSPFQFNSFWDIAGFTLGKEEMPHTIQGERLGILYFPLHVMMGVTALLMTGQWHGQPINQLETGPHFSSPPVPW